MIVLIGYRFLILTRNFRDLSFLSFKSLQKSSLAMWTMNFSFFSRHKKLFNQNIKNILFGCVFRVFHLLTDPNDPLVKMSILKSLVSAILDYLIANQTLVS